MKRTPDEIKANYKTNNSYFAGDAIRDLCDWAAELQEWRESYHVLEAELVAYMKDEEKDDSIPYMPLSQYCAMQEDRNHWKEVADGLVAELANAREHLKAHDKANGEQQSEIKELKATEATLRRDNEQLRANWLAEQQAEIKRLTAELEVASATIDGCSFQKQSQLWRETVELWRINREAAGGEGE